MRILALDPSGNFGREGMGTTGWCVIENGKIKFLDEIKASDYATIYDYWSSHRYLIETMKNYEDQVVIEGFRLYETKAKSQVQSEMPTSKLLGFLEMVCFDNQISLTTQFASEVKKRWHEDILVKKGILELKNGRYLWNGKATNAHQRDALKHALHFSRYKIGEGVK
jgi:hypothetical protein